MAPICYHEGRFPPQTLDWPRLIPLIGPAAAAVARYDGMLAAVPNSTVLLTPLTTQEAVLSSRIEGTQATMGEVLEFEAGQQDVSPERREDIREVLNYRVAMRELSAYSQSCRFTAGDLRNPSGIVERRTRPGQSAGPVSSRPKLDRSSRMHHQRSKVCPD